jgi:hypothetical protein
MGNNFEEVGKQKKLAFNQKSIQISTNKIIKSANATLERRGAHQYYLLEEPSESKKRDPTRASRKL